MIKRTLVKMWLIVVFSVAFGVALGHNTNVYHGQHNAGVTLGPVGYEWYNDRVGAGFFTPESK
jgi:hypothetical protein